MSSWEMLYDGSTNKYLGYVASVEQAMKLIREYELKTTSTLSCFKAENTFGQGDPFAKSRKVYFKDDNIPFDGSPFFIIATKVFDCRHGPDRKKASKKKLAQEKYNMCRNMADMSRASLMFQVFALVLLSFCIHKKQLIQSDGISITILEEDEGMVKENYIFRQFGVTIEAVSFLFINQQGERACGLFTKFHSVEELFDRHENIDILTLSETHIVNGHFDDNEDLYKIPGYIMLVKSTRKVGRGGGVAIYIKECIEWRRRQDLENDSVEIMWIEVFIKNSKRWLVAVYYRPSESSSYFPANFDETFNDTLRESANESKEIIILGDFNINFLKACDVDSEKYVA
ncbi:Hypothetical predicted protein [Paramuricea clavata]|uniref:Endonuclease/exonuclease/phosphatase domain-containing protein n=1 Tax=Paramuricea clavata TaxID=317549 RepID=A0A6S7IJE2_PARCT|nr:Hypothetical predicted protein [Paramuricea clavata]